MNRLFIFLVVTASAVAQKSLPPTCTSKIFCDSELLHRVQLARLYNDSKTFVDLHLRFSEDRILNDFNDFLANVDNPTREQLQSFVDEHFDSTSELEDWTPPDYSKDPQFLQRIRDEKLKQFGRDINNIWPILGRKVKSAVFENPDRFSLIPVDNGFIIPGGRFREIYYWDTYWIIKGLLISGMEDTARGMIENLIELLLKLGHVPNGSRWYYQERSQPPLLSAMMKIYLEKTSDFKFLEQHIDSLEKELNYWLDTQVTSVQQGGYSYNLLRYNVPSAGPRPESYYEDYKDAQTFVSDERKQEFYTDIKSAAESGWDFSSRWYIDNNGQNTGNLSTIHTRNIIPVDLNAIFANALKNMAAYRKLVPGRSRLSFLHWSRLAKKWQTAIEKVFWNEEDGIWYDYEITSQTHRKYFYPTNVSPLWMKVINDKLVNVRSVRVLNYLEKSRGLDFPGGIPSSLIRSGEQWDFPNAWPPLVSMVVGALDATNSRKSSKMALQVAETWVRACYKGFTKNKQMFEKYDVEVSGQYGGGGEYVVQSGFGWSNGVILEFLDKYGDLLTVED